MKTDFYTIISLYESAIQTFDHKITYTLKALQRANEQKVQIQN